MEFELFLIPTQGGLLKQFNLLISSPEAELITRDSIDYH